MTENNKMLLMKANEAVAKGDYEAFLQYCTEDTEWTFVGDKVLNGKEEVRRWMLTEYTEPPTFDVTNLIAENEHVTVLGHISLINKKGTSVLYRYCDVWKFREGKMAQLTAFVIEPKNEK
jgi:ketosteroid isomerase-like protein